MVADLMRGFMERSSTVFLRRGGKSTVSSAEDVLGLLAPQVPSAGIAGDTGQGFPAAKLEIEDVP